MKEIVGMGKGNPFVALRLPRDQQVTLRASAAAAGLTLSDLVRQVLTDFLDGRRQRPQVLDVQLRRRATAVGGKHSRKASRPVRLQRAVSEIEDLLGDYENWQANQPETLQETATAVALADAIDNLQQAAELLNAIILPRGFGRD